MEQYCLLVGAVPCLKAELGESASQVERKKLDLRLVEVPLHGLQLYPGLILVPTLDFEPQLQLRLLQELRFEMWCRLQQEQWQ